MEAPPEELNEMSPMEEVEDTATSIVSGILHDLVSTIEIPGYVICFMWNHFSVTISNNFLRRYNGCKVFGLDNW